MKSGRRFNGVVFVAQFCYLIASFGLSAEAGCPSRCVCSADNVTCAKKFLTSVPNFETLQEEPKLIDLSGNDIEFIEITDFSFDKNVEVQYLYLNSNSILDISANSFVELKNLHTLSLSNNILEDLPSEVISKNPKLHILDLSNNIFGHNPPKIISESLEILDLSFSKIEVFNDSHLSGIPNLKVLFLQDNNLQYLNPTIFGVAKDLFYVNVAINTWNCNCKTLQMFDFLVEHQLTEIKSSVTCVSQKKNYIQIYTSKGPVEEIKAKCSSNDTAQSEFNFENVSNLTAQNEMLMMEEAEDENPDEIMRLEQLLDLSETDNEGEIKDEYFDDEDSGINEDFFGQNSRMRSEVSSVNDSLTFYFMAMCYVLALIIGVMIGVIVTSIKQMRNQSALSTNAITSIDNMPYTLIVSKN